MISSTSMQKRTYLFDDTAKLICDSISMTSVAVAYGFTPNRSGFISCPFHNDKTASLKVYEEPGRGWYCFGCGEGGSVIDFVRKLYGDSFIDACKRLNFDFGLGLNLEKAPDKNKVSEIVRERRKKEAEKKAYEKKYTQLSVRYKKVCDYIKDNPPQEEMTEVYAKALKLKTDLEVYFETHTFKGMNNGF